MNRNLPTKERRFTGDYAKDGKARRLKVRAEAGHRCVRCGHPFESGRHGKGEWSPCDSRCEHGRPYKIRELGELRDVDGFQTAGALVRDGWAIEAQWRILTVHHLDGDKGNDAWWNTLALCQRCHLEIQGKVDPEIPYFLEHSPWFRPYAAAFYAKKYLNQILTREQVMSRLDELLQLELRA